jgi:hypothetical protein
MHKQKSFPLRIGEQERRRARRLALTMGLSENRLYSGLIQEGPLMRERMAYFEKLRGMRVPANEGLVYRFIKAYPFLRGPEKPSSDGPQAFH